MDKAQLIQVFDKNKHICLSLFARRAYFFYVATAPKDEKTILCLAHSRRPSGRCVAGKELVNGKLENWIRPVSARQNRAITASDMNYQNGAPSCVLDIIEIPMIAAQPRGHHAENHVIDSEFYWEKIGDATWAQIVQATDEISGPLWANDGHSFHGVNDKVTQSTIGTLTNSLFLIKPQKLSLVVARESKFGGGSERRVRAKFRYNSVDYNFVVTDPWIENKYFTLGDGSYDIIKSRLCISLPEGNNGATKLVASVITPDRIGKNNA